MERIDIQQIDLANEKTVSSKALYIELGDDYLIYFGNYVSSQPKAKDQDDHSLGWEDVPCYFKHKIKREKFVSVEMRYKNTNHLTDACWIVDLEAEGYPNTLKFYFATKREATDAYNRLDKFIFTSE